MKISKVLTHSYAIPLEEEKRFLKPAGNNFTAYKRYLPLGVFRVVCMQEEKKGKLFKKTIYTKAENIFFVDLSHGDLYYLKPRELAHPRPQLVKTDLIKRVIEFNDEVVQTIGRLYEYGSIPLDQIDRGLVTFLKTEGLIELYEPEGNQFFNFIRQYLYDDRIARRHYVRPSFHLPKFSDHSYNLNTRLKIVDTVDDNYEKDPVRFNHERLMEAMGYFFGGTAVLTGVAYLPYIMREYELKGDLVSEVKYLICDVKEEKVKTGYEDEKKLEPIAFSTAMGPGGSVPLESSTITFVDVADLTEVKEKIRRTIVYPLTKPKLAKKFKRKGGGSILFYGPPGCGKTYLARATVGECGINFFNINTSDIISGGAEEGAKALHEIFSRAGKNAPCILFFDEIDALGGRRGGSQEGPARAVVNQFLMEMDGVEGVGENILIIGSTNMPWEMDPALRRAGRFTDQIFVPPPGKETRELIFGIHTKDKPVASDVDFKRLGELTDDYSSADIKAIVDDALEIPWEEALHGKPARKADTNDFLSVLKERESSLHPWYKIAEKEIRESGEVELFSELANYILKHAGGVDAAVKPTLNFSDVAGLVEVKEKIREAIIYPLQHPEVSEKYGREVGGGLLLYGPPGCGKTYIARASAGECDAAFFNVNITDILSDKPGEPERRLKNIFERARRNTPCILFFDEIDALGGRREGLGGGRTLVNQFLTELDGFAGLSGVVVMASTNAPWDVDPALRRAGRFTDQIFVPPPGKETRESVFGIHAREKPAAPDINFSRLAELTAGYSSADIKAIVDDALSIPWRESLQAGEERTASQKDFEMAARERNSSLPAWFKLAHDEINKSGEFSVYPELSDYILTHAGGIEAEAESDLKFADVADMEDVKDKIKKMIVYPLTKPALAEKYGRAAGGGILFYGPPGCGKTYIARATAGECDATFFNVRITDILSGELGEAERRLSAIFERASRNTPSILFFDEIDALAARRGEAGPTRTLVNQFLTEMDGFKKREGVMIVGSTNIPWAVDPALRRAGRFTDQIYIPPPDDKTRELIFGIHTRDKPVDSKMDFKGLAESTAGYSSADIKAIVDEALEMPWEEALSGKPERLANMSDFKDVIEKRRSSLPPWFKLARTQMEESGERDVYPELWESVGTGVEDVVEPPKTGGLPKLDYDIRETKEQISILKNKKKSGEIDDKTYREIIKDLQKKLLKLEAQKND